MAHDLLVLNDNILRNMVDDVRITAIVPCLSQSKTKFREAKAQCGKCSAKQARAAGQFMSDAKTCIISLRGDTLKRFKGLIDANKIRVKVQKGGKIVTYTL
jgi:hypothetical protein